MWHRQKSSCVGMMVSVGLLLYMGLCDICDGIKIKREGMPAFSFMRGENLNTSNLYLYEKLYNT